MFNLEASSPKSPVRELSSVAQNFLRRAAPNLDPNVHLNIMREATDWVQESGSVEKSMDSCGPRGDLFFAIKANQRYFEHSF